MMASIEARVTSYLGWVLPLIEFFSSLSPCFELCLLSDSQSFVLQLIAVSISPLSPLFCLPMSSALHYAVILLYRSITVGQDFSIGLRGALGVPLSFWPMLRYLSQASLLL